MERKDKIVVTGTGIVCGAGSSVEAVWNVIESGKTAISQYDIWDPTNWPVKMGCQVKESNRDLVSERKLHKSISRTDMFGIYAGERAIDQSGLIEYRKELADSEQLEFNDRSGLIVGSGGGNFRSSYEYFPLMTAADRDLKRFGADLNGMVSPMWLLQNLPNNVLCHVGIRAQFKGTNACITNQIAGGIMSIIEAAESIWYNEADRVVAIGHDTLLEPESIYYYDKMGLISQSYPKPFDTKRDGIVIGEGAGALVLERAGDAKARNQPVLGEILGHGVVTESSGIASIDDNGDGVERAVSTALKNAGVSKDEIGMICAHGNGTRSSDLTEALAIKRIFDKQIPPVTSMKWAYGHLIGAAGIVDSVITLECLRRGVVPGIGPLNEIDSQFDDLPVSKHAQKPRSNIGLVISRGFAGMNVALIVRGE